VCALARDAALFAREKGARDKAAEEALLKLVAYHHKLVQRHHLHVDLVRREWATVMLPTPEEKERCDSLLQAAKWRESVRLGIAATATTPPVSQ
jgi:hypothetical protein